MVLNSCLLCYIFVQILTIHNKECLYNACGQKFYIRIKFLWQCVDAATLTSLQPMSQFLIGFP
jgi:hypothetical protein